jgi:hypothetical protein
VRRVSKPAEREYKHEAIAASNISMSGCRILAPHFSIYRRRPSACSTLRRYDPRLRAAPEQQSAQRPRRSSSIFPHTSRKVRHDEKESWDSTLQRVACYAKTAMACFQV